MVSSLPLRCRHLSSSEPSFQVLMITPDYPPKYTGGCAFSCQLLVEGLRSLGVHTDVWAFNGDDSPAIKGESGDTVFFETARTLGGLNRLAYRELMKREPDCDIIHVYNTQQLPAAVRYGRKANKKVVATLNNLAPICTNPSAFSQEECAGCRAIDSLICALERPGSFKMRMFMPLHWAQFICLHRLSRQADGYIALSEATRRCYIDTGYDPTLIHVIPNMYDPGKRRTKGAIERGEGKVVLYVGRLEAEKGLQVLIKAFARMGDGSTLYIVGKGGHETQLRKLVKELGLDGKVVLTGFVDRDQVGRYYGMADVFVHPALWPEPFPRTILEALSYGLPIVVSDSGSSANILGNAGLSFTSGDDSELAERLRSVLEDDEMRKRIADAGEEVLQRYHPDRVMAQIMDFYRSLLS